MIRFANLRGKEIGALSLRMDLAPHIGSHVTYDDNTYIVRDVTYNYDISEAVVRLEGVTTSPYGEFISTERLDEVARLAKGGSKLAAVKLYKDLTGVGLKEAKDYVDSLS